MNQTVAELRDELKRYLQFLKDCGIDAAPLQSRLQTQPKGTFSTRQETPTPKASPEPKPAPAKNPAPEMASTRKTKKETPAASNSAIGLQGIREEMGECTRCKLSEGRKTIVFGSGNPEADLLFIGEGPGADEDEQGLPFVGRAGKKLTEIIEKGMLLDRERDTYICNIVKCRPPGNRDPEAEEIAACQPFLEKEVLAVKPKVIVALGKPAASTLLGRSVAITKERGTWHEYMGVPLMLTLHPAYLLRAYTLENRRAVMDDMTQVLNRMKS